MTETLDNKVMTLMHKRDEWIRRVKEDDASKDHKESLSPLTYYNLLFDLYKDLRSLENYGVTATGLHKVDSGLFFEVSIVAHDLAVEATIKKYGMKELEKAT